ncbi:DUF4145 domain-containing protein, partial [Vibrio parahaemolyticus]|nr:DUF4145 domain-containing protein [Vibrio parahaemolyticus]
FRRDIVENILFPENLKESYLVDVADVATKRQYRAVAVRSCIELLLEHLFFQFVSEMVIYEKWSKLSVYQKIELIRETSSFEPGFYENLHNLRLTGNKGAHASEHGNITDEELRSSFNCLSSLCTSLIFEYFKINGMQSTENTSTIFSCLQPHQRLTVLNNYIAWLGDIECDIESSKRFYLKYVQAFRNNDIDETVYRGHFPKPLRLQQSLNRSLSHEYWVSSSLKCYDELLLVIDKLCLAYLKSGSFFLAISVARRFYLSGHITEFYYDQLCLKLNDMYPKVSGYPIAKSQKESIYNLSQIESICSKDIDIAFAKLIRCILTNEN